MSYYKNQYVPTTVEATTSASTIDALLDNETAQNRAEPWNKLNKTMKIQKINAYAAKYAAENNVSEEDLRKFLMNCLDKSRLQNTKDIKNGEERKQCVFSCKWEKRKTNIKKQRYQSLKNICLLEEGGMTREKTESRRAWTKAAAAAAVAARRAAAAAAAAQRAAAAAPPAAHARARPSD
jgi:hypothetical protein